MNRDASTRWISKKLALAPIFSAAVIIFLSKRNKFKASAFACRLLSETPMPYSFYAVLNVLPQIAVAAVLPILGIVLVSFLIKTTRPQSPEKPVGLD